MANHGESARKLHANGNSCSAAYGSLKCAELLKGHGRRCNEFVGFAADYVEERL